LNSLFEKASFLLFFCGDIFAPFFIPTTFPDNFSSSFLLFASSSCLSSIPL
jgi:hypothetical protein